MNRIVVISPTAAVQTSPVPWKMSNCEVFPASSAGAGLALVQQLNPQAVLIEGHASDTAIRDVGVELKRQRPELICLMMPQARRAGDCAGGLLERPPDPGTPGWQVALTLLAALGAPRPLAAPEAHSLQRWAG